MITPSAAGNGAFVSFGCQTPVGEHTHYQAELPSDLLDEQGQLIDRLIDFVFETLEISHLDLRVGPPDRLQGERYK